MIDSYLMKIVKDFIIKAYKNDGSLDKSWQCELLEKTVDYYLFRGVFENAISHKILGLIEPQTVSYEYYWTQKSFNVFTFFNPDGSFRCFYCNINTIPEIEDGVLSYTDLEVDLIVWKDFKIQIVDLDDFSCILEESNDRKKLAEIVESALSELLSIIANRKFPFDNQKPVFKK